MEKDQLWKHAKLGRPRKFKTPEELWNTAVEYFTWCDENPISKGTANYGRQRSDDKIDKQMSEEKVQRPYSIYGLRVWTGISDWSMYKISYRNKKGFPEVFRMIEDIIAGKQVDGAMAGIYNANLTARLNGIAEKTESNVDVKASVKSYEELLQAQAKLKDEY